MDQAQAVAGQTGALLFLAAGNWRWVQAWAFLAIFAIGSIAFSAWLLRRDPALLEYAGRDLFKVRIFPIEPNAIDRLSGDQKGSMALSVPGRGLASRELSSLT